MSHELYKRYRPQHLAHIFGQPRAVAQLQKALKKGLDHAILLSGPTGTGKTTLMRILRREIKCSDNDYSEINTSDFKGIDTIRDLRRTINLQPFGGETKVVGIDECHKLTNDAQNAILKLLEDPPDHAYFILGTTDPHKLLKALIGRCTEYKLNPIQSECLMDLMRVICKREKFAVSDGLLEDIAEIAEGSARKALVILDAVSKEEGDEAQRRAIQVTSVDKDKAAALAKMLVWPRGEKWIEVAALIRELEDYDAEGVRQLILGFARAALIGPKGGGKPSNPGRGAMAIEIFQEMNIYSGHPGLALACFKIYSQR